MKVEIVKFGKDDYIHCCVFINKQLKYSKGDYYHDKGYECCSGYVDCLKEMYPKANYSHKTLIITENQISSGWLSDEELQTIYENGDK